jgi:hypothetical protein
LGRKGIDGFEDEGFGFAAFEHLEDGGGFVFEPGIQEGVILDVEDFFLEMIEEDVPGDEKEIVFEAFDFCELFPVDPYFDEDFLGHIFGHVWRFAEAEGIVIDAVPPMVEKAPERIRIAFCQLVFQGLFVVYATNIIQITCL